MKPKLKFRFTYHLTEMQRFRLKMEKGLLLKKIIHRSKRGLNYIEYDLSIENDVVKKYEKYLNEEKKKDKKEIKLKKADNEKYYLHKGNYTIEVSINGKSAKETLKIKGRKK